MPEEIVARPWLKWAGGKRSLLARLLARAPRHIETYHEPFVGGGALFFALAAEGRFRRARLNDSNVRLMRAYRAVQRDPESVLRRLRRMPNEPEFFERQRRRRIDRETDEAVAAWLIYLNRTCYNGLYRVNRAGEFNAPYGRYENPRIADEENLLAASRALRGVKLSHADFGPAMLHAEPGDFVFCDPPYMPRVGREFTTYTAGGFGRPEHERLRDYAAQLRHSRVRVLVSNSGTEEVREMYEGFEAEEVRGRRSIGADEFRRGDVPDLLLW